MGGLVRGKTRAGSAKEKLQSLMNCVEDYFAKLEQAGEKTPDYVRYALATAFPSHGSGKTDDEVTRAANEISSVFLKYQIRDFRERTERLASFLNDQIYEIYRWAGPSDNENAERIVKGVVRFRHHRSTNALINFTLKYRAVDPSDPSNSGINASTAWGVLVPIGNHFMLVGVESREDYPLLVMFQFDFDNPNKIGGIVLRKADTKGQIITSRVLFVQNSFQNKPSEDELNLRFKKLTAEAGIYSIDKMPEEVVAQLEKFENGTTETGRQALTLKSAT